MEKVKELFFLWLGLDLAGSVESANMVKKRLQHSILEYHGLLDLLELHDHERREIRSDKI